MKTVKRLNIQGKPSYFFMNMTITKDGSIVIDISFCEENNRAHIFFNGQECIFKKSGVFSYLIFL